ncbi:MAG: hypothetical protein D6795_16265, partial [Deltaproteobacteria bacterium]
MESSAAATLAFLGFLLASSPSPAQERVGGRWVAEWQVQGSQRYRNIGRCLHLIGDLDGDGIGEVASPLSVPNPELHVWSGRDGSFFWSSLPALGGSWALWGQELDTVPDANGDSVPDLIVGDPGYRPSGSGATGIAVLLSGSTGAVLHSILGSSPPSSMGNRVVGLADLDGDGRGDFGVSDSSAGGFTSDSYGQIWVHSGATGQVIWSVLGSHRTARLGLG